MLISIIIPTLNEETHIAKTLTHTLKLKGNFEILVVDGGSNDRTIEIVKDFPEVKRYCAPKGRALQMNLGARHAQGEILVFLHADTFLPKEAFASICELCKAKDTVGGSFRLVVDDPNPIFKSTLGSVDGTLSFSLMVTMPCLLRNVFLIPSMVLNLFPLWKMSRFNIG